VSGVARDAWCSDRSTVKSVASPSSTVRSSAVHSLGAFVLLTRREFRAPASAHEHGDDRTGTHRPEDTLLYDVVESQLERFLAHAREHRGRPLPRYVANSASALAHSCATTCLRISA
jgi:hypothetical protein